jgi:hypothetical protein
MHIKFINFIYLDEKYLISIQAEKMSLILKKKKFIGMNDLEGIGKIPRDFSGMKDRIL